MLAGKHRRLKEMPLTDAEHPLAEILSGVNALGVDEKGVAVVVSASTEAIQDYGWPAIWEAASRKYDAGEASQNDGRSVVRVTTSDF
jgi:hypothetical protein